MKSNSFYHLLFLTKSRTIENRVIRKEIGMNESFLYCEALSDKKGMVISKL